MTVTTVDFDAFDWLAFIGFAAVPIALLGANSVSDSMRQRYETARKRGALPWGAPPGGVFGLLWALFIALIGLAGFFLSEALPWQGIMALVLIPAIFVMLIAATTSFPPPIASETGVTFGEMISEIFRRPSFFIWFGAMFLTAASELAPGQWIDVALSNRVGMRGILLLVYVSALMFVFRHFAGKLAHVLSNPGLLWFSSLLAAIGLYMLAQAQSPVAAPLSLVSSKLGGPALTVAAPSNASGMPLR